VCCHRTVPPLLCLSYSTQKEAKEALRKEKEMEAEMKRQAAARRKELEKMEKEKAEAEKSQKKALEKAQSEIYMTMQEARKLQAKRQKEEEVKMESLCVSFLSRFLLFVILL
jgi:hypothetical protein